MYTIEVQVRGSAPLLQHRFDPGTLSGLMTGSKKQVARMDYSQEWLATMYVTTDGHLYQPATHLEGALVNAAVSFKIKGRRGKTYKDVVRAYCRVEPDRVTHHRDGQPVLAPSPDLLEHPTDTLSVSVLRVRVNRAAVARARLEIAPGWELAFHLIVQDDSLPPEVVRTILEEAGRAVGIGDYRPRYGRFDVLAFDVP